MEVNQGQNSDMGEGVSKTAKKSDVFYGRPHTTMKDVTTGQGKITQNR